MMVKQWVQPPINENRLPYGGSLLGSHLTSFSFYVYYLGFQYLGDAYIDFNKGFNQI
jgi:hypothetical protein